MTQSPTTPQSRIAHDGRSPDRPSPCGRPLLYAAENLSLYHSRESPKQGAAHSHDDVQIALPIDGGFHAAWQTAGGRQRQQAVFPGTLSLSAPQQPHTVWVERETELAVIWLPPAVLAGAYGERQAGGPGEIVDSGGTQDALLQQLCLALLAEVRRNRTPDRLYIDAAANLLAAQLLRRHSTRPRTEEVTGGLSPRRLKRVLAYVHENLGRDIALADLAGAAGLSVSHFGPLFRQSTGVTPYRYVLSRRIEWAQSLLCSGHSSVGEVAQQVGFCDQSHFTRQFKQQVGLTPRAFLKAAS